MGLLVVVNGADQELSAGATVADAVAATVPGAGPSGRGLAVALNGEVVPRTAWPATALSAGDRVEVLTAVQGG